MMKCKIRNIMLILMTLIGSTVMQAAVPKSFEQLGTDLEEDRLTVRVLRENSYFKDAEELFQAYEKELENAFVIGRRLDDAIARQDVQAQRLRKEYLEALRKVQRQQRMLYRHYADALDDAMMRDERPLFKLLIEHRMAPLENRHIRNRIKTYYASKPREWRFDAADRLVAQMRFEAASRSAYAAEMQAYETRAEVSLRDNAKDDKRILKQFRNLTLFARTKENGYAIYAENANPYSITSTLRFVNLRNFRIDGSGSVSVELASGSVEKVAELSRLSAGKASSFGFEVTMSMGWASAIHDAAVHYRLPFKTGSQVLVSQGYNGASTHRGASRYAVDFQVPVGTPVYAARSGKVVTAVATFRHGAFDRALASRANHVIIEHEDHTYAQYAHLMHDGVAVSVGDRVTAGTLIGYSGNTGYSSGPHLHFEVFTLDPSTKKQMLSIPVRFLSGNGIVSNPGHGQRYIVTH